jgi:LysM repeat protein
MADVRVNLRVIDGFSGTLNTYQREMNKAAQASQKAAAAAGGVTRETTAMGRALRGALGAITVVGAVAIAKEIYKVGVESRVATAALEKLAAQVGGVEVVMNSLRHATGGVVDDITLMHGANRFLTMGIAQTSDEVARLTQAALVLGRVMGYSGQEAIESFSLLLSNESVLRLDNFGLSAAKIRNRMAELREENEKWTRSDAFRAAVLEEIANKFGMLGDAADEAFTPVYRIATILENMKQDFSSGASTVLDAAAQALFNLADGIDAVNQGNAILATHTAAWGMTADQYMGSGYLPTIDRTNATTGERIDSNIQIFPPSFTRHLATAIQEAFAAGETFDAPGSREAFFQRVFTEAPLNQGDFNTITGEYFTGSGQNDPGMAQIYQRMNAVLVTFQNYSEDTNRALQAQERALTREQNYAAAAALLRSDSAYNYTPFDQVGWNQQMQAGLGMWNPAWMQREYSLGTQAQDTLRGSQYYSQFASQGNWNGQTLMSAGDAAQLQYYADEMNKLVDIAEGLAENMQIRPEALESIRNYAAVAQGIADNAARTREEFDNASLSQIFGQQDAGRLGEMDQMLLSAYADSGASPEMQDAFNRMLGLDNGSLTLMSEQFRTTGIPMILDVVNDLGFEAGLRARDAVMAAMEEGAASGYTGVLPYDIIMRDAGYNLSTGSIDYGGGSGTSEAYNVRSGDTLWDIARQRGMTVDQVRAAAGLQPGQVLQAGSTINFSGPGGQGGQWQWDQSMIGNTSQIAAQQESDTQRHVDSIVGSFRTGMEDVVGILTTGLEQLSTTPFKIPIELVINAAGTDVLSTLIGSIVTNNGGVPPGASGKAGKSGSSRSGNTPAPTPWKK